MQQYVRVYIMMDTHLDYANIKLCADSGSSFKSHSARCKICQDEDALIQCDRLYFEEKQDAGGIAKALSAKRDFSVDKRAVQRHMDACGFRRHRFSSVREEVERVVEYATQPSVLKQMRFTATNLNNFLTLLAKLNRELEDDAEVNVMVGNNLVQLREISQTKDPKVLRRMISEKLADLRQLDPSLMTDIEFEEIDTEEDTVSPNQQKTEVADRDFNFEPDIDQDIDDQTAT